MTNDNLGKSNSNEKELERTWKEREVENDRRRIFLESCSVIFLSNLQKCLYKRTSLSTESLQTAKHFSRTKNLPNFFGFFLFEFLCGFFSAENF